MRRRSRPGHQQRAAAAERLDPVGVVASLDGERGVEHREGDADGTEDVGELPGARRQRQGRGDVAPLEHPGEREPERFVSNR